MNCPTSTYPLEDATLTCTSTDYRITGSYNKVYIILEQSDITDDEVGNSRTVKFCDMCHFWKEVE